MGKKMNTNISFFLSIFIFAVGCEDETKCQESSSITYVSEDADFTYEGPFDVSGYPSGDVRIEVWDCVDASWWGPVDEQKIVQVYSNVDGCGDFSDIEQLIFECDDENSIDKFVRDDDGDGVFRVDDCDDSNASIGTCEENSE